MTNRLAEAGARVTQIRSDCHSQVRVDSFAMERLATDTTSRSKNRLYSSYRADLKAIKKASYKVTTPSRDRHREGVARAIWDLVLSSNLVVIG